MTCKAYWERHIFPTNVNKFVGIGRTKALQAGKTLGYWTDPQRQSQQQAEHGATSSTQYLHKYNHAPKYLKCMRWTLICLIRPFHNLNVDQSHDEGMFVKHLQWVF